MEDSAWHAPALLGEIAPGFVCVWRGPCPRRIRGRGQARGRIRFRKESEGRKTLRFEGRLEASNKLSDRHPHSPSFFPDGVALTTWETGGLGLASKYLLHPRRGTLWRDPAALSAFG
jgi:hypothetical protein